MARKNMTEEGQQKGPKQKMPSLGPKVKGALGALAAGYGALLFALWLKQEKLLFDPEKTTLTRQEIAKTRARRRHRFEVREFFFKTKSGAWMQVFVSEPSQPLEEGSPLAGYVMYLGGVKEDTSWTMSLAKVFLDWKWICFNYQGFGFSGGRPSEKAIVEDSEDLFAFLREIGEIKPEKTCLIGRSLGSGVAARIASKNNVRSCALITPYHSVADIAQSRYWFVPVKWLLRHHFEAISWARATKIPMIMALAEEDKTVPHASSARLFAAWSGPKELFWVKGTNHSDIVKNKGMFERMEAFFKDAPEPKDNPLRTHEAHAEGLLAHPEWLGKIKEKLSGAPFEGVFSASFSKEARSHRIEKEADLAKPSWLKALIERGKKEKSDPRPS